jgi:hypothetical protein
MNVFELDEALVNDYERFARSFTQIRAPDIRTHVEALYARDRFWPEPLVSINPRFERGASIDQLVGAGSLHEATAQVFSIDGKPLSLYRHQAQAIAKATAGQSFVVTTELVRANLYAFLFQSLTPRSAVALLTNPHEHAQSSFIP